MGSSIGQSMHVDMAGTEPSPAQMQHQLQVPMYRPLAGRADRLSANIVGEGQNFNGGGYSNAAAPNL